MDVDLGPVAQSYTILRIKRKRNEEPLDALVVESRRRKKSRGASGILGASVFQFAQTVEHDAWEDEKRKRDIQDQVSRLARESASSNPNADSSEAKAPNPRASPSIPKEDRRYKIIPQEEDAEEASTRRRLPTSPPRVISAKDLPPKAPQNKGFKLYDAVLSPEKPAKDEEMEKFLPMLNDYLKLNEIDLATSSSLASSLHSSASTSATDDYVWDVFYHRPATLTEWNEVANVGTLTGLPPSLTDPYDSASDSEEEDEADEDSNAEEYYKNDYPDEEDSSDDDSGDEFHEDSENEYQEDDSDHDWR
ncbi:hypothetical protein FB45DRAFT_897592 [Roridomyces roridus]|uniref:Probable RNA polymerase II nuclear localization protein SLC7A6OS n=1 Tax=Roridomyces roridus TaxID=1738132 RepID=A0AAD7FXB9_9AGAR|nr:hypothetical protein FB45DRAFT_897592 [Roridomyces roridus]